jgi:hypothetical protein
MIVSAYSETLSSFSLTILENRIAKLHRLEVLDDAQKAQMSDLCLERLCRHVSQMDQESIMYSSYYGTSLMMISALTNY